MDKIIKPEKTPSMAAFVVQENDGETYWRRIGAAFDHKDGRGKTILVDAWPVGDRLMLRDVEDEKVPEIKQEIIPRRNRQTTHPRRRQVFVRCSA